MSGRDNRDRGDRSSRATQQQSSARTNEYFVPKDGIDREVITADICRYLGNDALVRPGTYQDPQTRVAQTGYFITAYRNLTTAMIADLKADSARWDAERRQTASRGQPLNAEYRSSTTHQSRQYYGPTEATATAPQAADVTYQQGVYESPQYQSTTGYASQPQTYASTPQSYAPQDGPYISGAHYETRAERPSERASTQQQTIPRTQNVQYPSTTSYQQTDTRYYPPAGTVPSPVSAAQGYSTQQPPDPYYGRAPVAGNGGYETAAAMDPYDTRYAADPRVQAYQETPAYTSAQIPSGNATANSGAARRERANYADRDREEERPSNNRHGGRHGGSRR